MQSLINHTAYRIVSLQEDVVRQVAGEREDVTVELVCKWGFDGATAQSSYKQLGTSSPTEDSQVLFTSLVPLQLTAGDDIIWHNRTPSSSRFARPLKLEYCRETAQRSREEASYWKEQISQLEQHQIQLGGLKVNVTFRLLLTMIDGKVQAAITETSSTAVCTVCQAKPSQFNQLKQVRLMPVSQSALMLGLSTMHAWIRFFEFVVHLSYKAEEGVKQWTRLNTEQKKVVDEKRKRVQSMFWDRMGLHVDQPRPGGAGSSNDGNTARRAFRDEKTFAEITGVSEELIHRLHVILQVMASGHRIDPVQFGKYCDSTAELYIAEYPWYYMPFSVRKVLVHGAAVVDALPLPLGMLSEEAQEARNKDVRSYRLHHARKDSRLHNIADQFGYLLVTSDPKISSVNLSARCQTGATVTANMSREVLSLLNVHFSGDVSDASDSDA